MNGETDNIIRINTTWIFILQEIENSEDKQQFKFLSICFVYFYT